MGEFFADYLKYSGGGETPQTFNRWAAIGMVGAWMGRQVYFKFGNSRLHTNQYIMLLGSAGTKKNTAINTAKKLLKAAGYESFASEKTSKEKFLQDLAEASSANSEKNLGNYLDEALWGEKDTNDYTEIWIAKGEFNDFFSNNILDFVSMLGELWDFEGIYENRIKSGASVLIPNPTISIVGGNTQTAFAAAFPPEAVGQGFFSRVLAIYAKPTGVKVTWPKSPSEEETAALVARLQEMKEKCVGEITFSEEAKQLTEKIYTTWKPLPDIRFESYGNRRLTHLIKLAMVHAVTRCSMVVDTVDLVRANTVLSHAEEFMPRAYGDFGASKTSAQTHKILQIMEDSTGMTTQELWAHVQADFDKIETFTGAISGLVHAGKLSIYEGRLYPVKQVVARVTNDILDYSYLTEEEL